MMRCEDEGGTSVDQGIINLYDHFTHSGMSRREFLDRLAELAGSTAAAAALLPLLQNNYAQAAIVAADDARLAAERVSYDSPKGKINGYLVRGKALGKRPAVIVIHENRGLNPHIEDVARRLAVEGYLVLAPDLLSVNGGTPPEEDKARELHAKTEREDMIAAALAAIPFMQKHPESTGKVGAVGFCFGGGVVNRMAAGNGDLAAAVPYYGVQVVAEMVPAIKAPLDAFLNVGESTPVLITRNGKTVAVIVPVHGDEEVERLLMATSPQSTASLSSGEPCTSTAW